MTNAKPTLSKTWEKKVNQVIPGDLAIVNLVRADRAACLFAVKSTMTDGSAFTIPWVVVQSSNGTVADASDNIATVADIKWGLDSSDPNTSTRTWFVLHNAPLGVYLLLDCTHTSSGDNGKEMDAWISDDAYNVDGTTTTRPTTSGTEIQICNRLVSNDGTWEGNNSTFGVKHTYVVHGLMSTDGLETRIAITSGGACTALWIIGRPRSDIGTLTHDWFISLSPRSSNGSETPTVAKWNATDTPVYFQGMDNSGAKYDGRLRIPHNNDLNESWDDNYGGSPNAFDGRWTAPEITLCTEHVGFKMEIGVIEDVWWGPDNQSHAKTWPGASREFIQLGNVILPWEDGTIPIPSN